MDVNTSKQVRKGRFTYYIDEQRMEAWIKQGHIGRCKCFHVPSSVELEGKVYTITSVEIGAFNSPKTLKKLVIPDSINYIDEDSLYSLPNLRSIYIGKGLEFLNYWNFRLCPNLSSFVIDRANPQLKVEDGLVFDPAKSTVYKSLYDRDYYIVPEGVKVIMPLTFSWNNRLTFVDLPDSLEELGDEVFTGASKMEDLIMPNSVKKVGGQLCLDCENLKSAAVSESLENLGCEMFCGCRNLKKIVLGTFASNHLIEAEPEDLEGVNVGSCVLYVAKQLMDDYRGHPVWGQFKNIRCIDELL